ncbi:MAG: amidohydrolase [Bryobacterales bacterium]|nr:amidohydrolase [Bryobacterales bacterium]
MRLVVLSALLVSQALPAQLAIINGKVWTGDSRKPWAEAVLMDGDRIRLVGTTAEVRAAALGAQTVDALQRTVMPGFNDAHIHFLSGSLGLSQIDLTGVCSVEAMQRLIAAYASANPQKKWITGRGWEYYCFPDKLPRKEWIDAVVKDRPVFLSAYDGHTGWANSKALEMADINRATKFEGFGEIVKDPATGQPTGSLKEGAMSLVRKHVPATTREEKLAALRTGMKMAARLGITSFQNASGDEDELSLYEELGRQGEISMRAAIAMSVSPSAPPVRVDQIAALRSKQRHPYLRVGAVKLMIDGVIESHTAAMLAPYADDPKAIGEPAWPVPQFNDVVARLDAKGIQIYTHAIGDRGVRLTLDAYENAAKTNGKRDSRHRVEHIETIHPDDLPRFAKLGVMASMEPIHADPDTVEVWSKAVGPARLPLSFAWRSLEKAGARVVFSSDWPASISVNPIRGIHNAVNRRTVDGKPPGGWLPEQRVSLETALHGYTTQAAYASFEEATKGMIRAGMLADVIILSHDIFAIDPVKLHEATVVCTVFNGNVIYRR